MNTTIGPFRSGTRCEATYTNHRGETRLRRFVPQAILYAATVHHPEPQWLLEVFDVDKGETRTYALAGFLGEAGS